MSKKKSPFQIGQYWLEKEAKSPYWQYAWYSERHGRNKRKTTGLQDYEQALEWLTDFYYEKRRGGNGKITDIRPILTNYWMDHGKGLVAAPAIKTAINSFNKFLDIEEDENRIDGAAQITDLTPRLMNRFIKWRSENSISVDEESEEIRAFKKPTSPNTVQTYIKYIRAAVNWAHNNHEIDFVPKIAGLKKHQLNGPRKGYISFDMMADALTYAKAQPHLFRFILASIGTIARPETVLDIHPGNMMDWTQGFLDLNPPNRAYTSKHRPIVAVPELLIKWFDYDLNHTLEKDDVRQEYFTEYRGRHVRNIKKAWRGLRAELEWPENIVSKTIRHSVAKTLRNDAEFKNKHNLILDPWELSGHMGHMGGGGLDMTEEYAQYEPNVKSSVIQGLNAYFEELEDRLKFSLHPKNTRKEEKILKVAE